MSLRTPSFSLSYGLPFSAPRICPVVRARPAASSLYAESLDAEEEDELIEGEHEIGEQDVEAVNIAEDVSQVLFPLLLATASALIAYAVVPPPAQNSISAETYNIPCILRLNNSSFTVFAVLLLCVSPSCDSIPL